MLRRMTSGVHGGTTAVPVALLWLALLVPALGFGEGFTRLSVPIPVEIEGQPVHCQLYLKLEMKSYNVPFDQFAAGTLDTAQKMFSTAVKGIRKNDTAAFASVWTAPDEMSGHSNLTLKMADNSVASWMKLARSNIDFDHVTVVAEVLLGPDSMFIFDSAGKAGVQRYAFYVGTDKKGRTRLSAVGSNTPLELMVLNAFVGARTAPDLYKPLPNINLRYQYPIPLAGKMDSGAHPVFFEFDGTPMDFPLTDEKVAPPTPLLGFLRNATLAFEHDKYDVYASDFTPQGQQRVRPWLAEMERRKREKLQQEKFQREQPPAAPPPVVGPDGKPKPTAASSVAAHVKFVLNADPVFLVFQAPGQGSGWAPGNLTFTYVVHQGAEYKIANFSFSNTLDDFLQDSTLFDKRILKPAPQKAGAPKAKVAPPPANPAAVKH